MKKLPALALALLLLGSVAACNDADVVSNNISQEADKFNVLRRIIFYNGITADYMLTIEGYCSLGNHDDPKTLTVTCKVPGGYKKHFLGLSDNVTYFVEHLDATNVSKDHYKVV